MNLKLVATTATNAETGTASDISMSKKINIIGMLLPAPLNPPAFDRAIRKNIRTNPVICILGSDQNFLSEVVVVVSVVAANSVSSYSIFAKVAPTWNKSANNVMVFILIII